MKRMILEGGARAILRCGKITTPAWERAGKVLGGVVLPLALFAVGAVFLVTAGRRILRHPVRAVRGMLRAGEGSGTTPARALSVALAGTLGVGNIAGVASAVALGGAGAVFWMWVSALFAMMLKYAEIVLALATRRCDSAGNPHGGASYYIARAFGGRVGRAAGALFALLTLLAALTLGGMVQSHAAAEALHGAFGVPPAVTGALLAAAAVLALSRGAKRVEAVCAKLVPFVCLAFSVVSLFVLFRCRAALPAALGAILRGAFTVRGGVGGALGVLTSASLRYGVARGMVSNEAGCGTAPAAHAAAAVKSPAQQGLWGIFEVFVDTVLLCTLTALVLLTSGAPVVGAGGVTAALDAYARTLGAAAPPFLALAIVFFAYATLLCWSHYGGESLYYLTGRARAARWMIPASAAAAWLGAVAAPRAVWGATDLVLGAMALLNLAALLRARRTVTDCTRDFFDADAEVRADGCATRARARIRRLLRRPRARSSRR